MQMHGMQSSRASELDQPVQHDATDASTPPFGQHCHATDPTIRHQSAGADRLFVQVSRDHVYTLRVHRIQFQVAGNRLNCLLYQRSCDVALGLPFNLFGAALFTRMLAQQCDLEAGELIWMGGDTHLYLNHAELVETQLSRAPSGGGKLAILRRPESIFDYRIEDFEVTGYAPQAHISAPVAV